MKKRGEFGFVWIFALLVGGAILFFAVYGALKATEGATGQQNTVSTKEFTNLLNPLQAGFSESSYGTITFAQETKITNRCQPDIDTFGINTIGLATKTTTDTWTKTGIEQELNNKYLFSTETTTGKEFHIFSKQYRFPFKVADLHFIITGNYCFINAPEDIQDEITGIGIPTITFQNCEETATKVCFGNHNRNDCDILVSNTCGNECDYEYQKGIVRTQEEQKTYYESLLYAALFSDQDIYDCNVQRLMSRTNILANIYAEKTDLMSARNCASNLGPELRIFATMTKESDSQDLSELGKQAKELERRNTAEVCGVW